MPFDNLPELKPALRPEQRDLLKAADIMQKRGLCRYEFVNPDDEICAVCAIAIAQGRMTSLRDWEVWHTDAARESAAGVLLARHVGGHIDAWVLSPGRTADEVIAAMRAAATEEK